MDSHMFCPGTVCLLFVFCVLFVVQLLTHSTILLHAGGSLMVMKTQLVKIVTMMKTLNKVFVLRDKETDRDLWNFPKATAGGGDNDGGDNMKDMNE